MTEEQLAELEALAASATPGPWEAENDVGTGNLLAPLGGLPHMTAFAQVWTFGDAAFIAAARTSVPELIAEVRRLRALLEDCEPHIGHKEGCNSIITVPIDYPCDCQFDVILAKIGKLA